MKLWIDDIRTPPDNTWNICRTVSSAIRALSMFGLQIKEINLDHDISHQVVVGKMSRPYPCEETFKAVAQYIALFKQLHPEWNPKIQIHTSNHVGAQEMVLILTEVGLNPFSQVIAGANRLETIL